MKAKSIKTQLEQVKKDQHKEYWAQRSLTYDIEPIKTRNTQPDQWDIESNHRWPSGTCVVVGDLIVSGTDERRLSKKNWLDKECDFRAFTIDVMKHYFITIMKKEPDTIILHVKTSNVTSKTSRQILDHLLQLENFILKTIPNCMVKIPKPNIRFDNGKAAITIRPLNANLSQLESD